MIKQMQIICPICKSTDVKYIDAYKTYTSIDNDYFKNMKIFTCNICNLSFADPIPNKELLEKYYSTVYRRKGGPFCNINPEKVTFNEWQNSQYAYISLFFNFKKLDTVLDIGPGYGFLLREIRKNHKDIKLIAADIDFDRIKYLKKYNIELRKTTFAYHSEPLNFPHDINLILSSHSLEHMAEPLQFFDFVKKHLHKDGKLFLEVPNNSFTKECFLHRSFDSPHLFFMDKKSLMYMTNVAGFNVDHISTVGTPCPDVIIHMKKQYDRYHNKNRFDHLKSMINTIQYRFINSFKILTGKTINNFDYNWYQYGGNRSVLRAMLSKK